MANSDAIQIAGGPKCLASPELQIEREFVLQHIRKSIHLHGTRRVILMLHSDCGAYGGLDGDAGAERVHRREEVRHAAQNVRRAIPGVELTAYFVDFESVWEADLAAVCGP